MDFDLSEDEDEEAHVDDSGAMDLNSDDEDHHISSACDSLDEDDSPDW